MTKECIWCGLEIDANIDGFLEEDGFFCDHRCRDDCRAAHCL